MKKLYTLFFSVIISCLSYGQTVFINEIHYDDTSTDAGEGIEIAGPAGTDLTGYTLTPYNGSGGASYTPITTLTGIIPDEGGSGYGTLFFPIAGLQNGAPDAIAFSNGATLIQFLSYEGSFTGTNGIANGVTSTDIGVSEDASVEGSSLQLTGTGFSYSNFSWAAQAAATPGTKNTGQNFGTPLPSLSLDNGLTNGSVYVGTPEDVNDVAISFITKNFTMSSDAGGGTGTGGSGFIKWTIKKDGITLINSGNVFTSNDGFEYPITGLAVNNTYVFYAELVDNTGATYSPTTSYTLTYTIPAYIDVPNIAALRAGTISPDIYYRVTGEVINTFSRATRNQKYFQDATGGILVDDALLEISSTYNIGDGITNIRGKLFSFNGFLQFIPTPKDWGTATTTGNSITTPVVTLATLAANIDDYESELVQINGVTFAAGDGTAPFVVSTDYAINDPAAAIFRTIFSSTEVNYIGATIPQGPKNIIVLVTENSGVLKVVARSLSDINLSVNQNSISGLNIYPNPVKDGNLYITSNSSEAKSVSVYDILGKQVLNAKTLNNTVNVSNLKGGAYIVRITEDGKTDTRKLIIE